MLFPTHLLAGALCGRASRLPPGWAVLGAALPDLLDKPLGTLGVTELYHSVGHSLLFALAVVPLVLFGRAGAAVALGWVSHLALDALHVVLNGRPTDALFLGWPLVVPPSPPKIPPGEFFYHYLGSPSFLLEALLWGAVLFALLTERGRGWLLRGLGTPET
jgi:hypothetical protein